MPCGCHSTVNQLDRAYGCGKQDPAGKRTKDSLLSCRSRIVYNHVNLLKFYMKQLRLSLEFDQWYRLPILIIKKQLCLSFANTHCKQLRLSFANTYCKQLCLSFANTHYKQLCISFANTHYKDRHHLDRILIANCSLTSNNWWSVSPLNRIRIFVNGHNAP